MALPTGRGPLHRGRSVETGGAQRGPCAVAPAWVAGIEAERVTRGADVGPENTDCQRFGGPGPRSLGRSAPARPHLGWIGGYMRHLYRPSRVRLRPRDGIAPFPSVPEPRGAHRPRKN